MILKCEGVNPNGLTPFLNGMYSSFLIDQWLEKGFLLS